MSRRPRSRPSALSPPARRCCLLVESVVLGRPTTPQPRVFHFTRPSAPPTVTTLPTHLLLYVHCPPRSPMPPIPLCTEASHLHTHTSPPSPRPSTPSESPCCKSCRGALSNHHPIRQTHIQGFRRVRPRTKRPCMSLTGRCGIGDGRSGTRIWSARLWMVC